MNDGVLVQRSDELAYEFFQNKKYDLALKQTKISLLLDPENPKLFFNVAKCYYYNQEYNKAIDYMNKLLEMDPNNENAKREVALYLSWLGKHEESINILKTLPDNDLTKFNFGWYELRKGNLQKGFNLLEYGRNIKCWGSNIQLPLKKWNGNDISGKKLLVVNEGGVGDEIIFLRFLSDLVRDGIDVSVKPSKEMMPVFNRIINTVDETVDLNEFDYWIPSMNLPSAMKINSVSGSPYLTPDDSYVKKWKEKIGTSGLKIGVRWEGGDKYEYHQRRTIPINDLVSAISKGQLYSLQKNSKDKCPNKVINLEDQLETWEDTIAVISLMDVIITSCTAVAHISGALGKKTVVIVPTLSYFTWAVPTTKTDWYDSVKIIRQTNPYQWTEAIETLKQFF
jgi:tetratricopeptide (TPR) repeat protein